MLFIESFYISFPIMLEGKCQRLGTVDIRCNPIFDKGKFVLLVFNHDLQNHVQVIAASPYTLDAYGIRMDNLVFTLFLRKCGDSLVKGIGLGFGIVDWGITTYHPIGGICGQTVRTIVFGKMPSTSFIGYEIGAETLIVCLQTNHFGYQVGVDISFFAA